MIATGLLLDEANPSYERLVDPTSSLPEAGDEPRDADAGHEPELELAPDDEPTIYRLRVKAVASARTKILTLSAHSAELAREAALEDLAGEWTVLDVELR